MKQCKSEEHKNNISEAKKGKKFSHTHIMNLSNYYFITLPSGKEILYLNLMDFCRNNNLNHAHMYNIAKNYEMGLYGKGIREVHKQHKCRKAYMIPMDVKYCG